jgi:DNA-binding CsgD family transcriptional regulator
VDEHASHTRLTGRERQIANLIARGLTNKQIAQTLAISERTAGAHVQNILNKLGANNRAQIATWWANASGRPPDLRQAAPPPAAVAVAAPVLAMGSITRSQRARLLIAVCCVTVLIVAATDGDVPSAATSASPLIPGDLPLIPGELAFQASMNGQGDDFGPPSIVGDPTASQIRFVKGAVEFAVLKPGGLAGDNPVMGALPRYFAETQITVSTGSLVSFWFSLTAGDTYKGTGSYVLSVNTYDEYLQLGYFIQGEDVVWLSRPVPLNRLQTGRRFRISTLVDPPHYAVFVDGQRVIDLHHAPNTPLQAPSFQIFGDGVGAVRMSSLSIYRLESGG